MSYEHYLKDLTFEETSYPTFSKLDRFLDKNIVCSNEVASLAE
jgi:hypothetical protein